MRNASRGAAAWGGRARGYADGRVSLTCSISFGRPPGLPDLAGSKFCHLTKVLSLILPLLGAPPRPFL